MHARKLAAVFLTAILLSAQSAAGGQIPFSALRASAISALKDVQEISFREKVEYCGYLLWQYGKIRATKAVRGTLSDCSLPRVPAGSMALASFHTHGSHDPRFLSEVPSEADVRGDFDEEVYGFVSTPGGRIWLIDPFQGTIINICEAGCVMRDKRYRASDVPALPRSFTMRTLSEFLSH